MFVYIDGMIGIYGIMVERDKFRMLRYVCIDVYNKMLKYMVFSIIFI